MKPLLKKDIDTFISRFEGFIDAELRSIEILSPTSLKITLAAQDGARGFDWISISLELDGINDARLLDDSKLVHVDMSEGISILHEETMFALAIGNYDNFSNVTDSVCYVKASSLKYKEDIF